MRSAPSMPQICAAAILASIALLGQQAAAQDFAAPKGEVILTLAGAIGTTNAADALALDRTLLETLPQHEFATSTIWTEGVSTFRGVLLQDLLAVIGARGKTLTLTALNDYQITMPAAEAGPEGPLVAYLMDGAVMPVRDKGPVWLVYPYDSKAEYRTEQAYARSIWQLEHIEVGD